MNDLVKKITLRVFGQAPVSAEEIKGRGKANIVFKVNLVESSYILRLKQGETGLKVYQNEQWCSEACLKVGVPTPKILFTGIEAGYAFSVQDFIAGVPGDIAKEETGRIWRTLGQYAKQFNAVPAPQLAADYPAVIQDLFNDHLFVTEQAFSIEVSSQIKQRLEETVGWDFLPKLCHGNLYPNNVIVGSSGEIYLIDWGSATGNRVPQAELADLFTWNTGKENIALFLEGYGLESADVEIVMRDLQTLVLLRLLAVLRNKIKQNLNWQDDEFTQSMKVALNSIKDFQKDILFTKNL